MERIVTCLMLIFLCGISDSFAQEVAANQPDKSISAKPKNNTALDSKITVETALCSGIEERMPTGMADKFTSDVGTVFLWCRVLGAEDSTIVQHVWYYKEEHKATVELPVKSSSWRTWSSKNLLPNWTGQWEVKVLDSEGTELKSILFEIVAASAKSEE